MNGEAGPLLFARFAYPPNALGYCGPDAAEELLDYANAATIDARLRQLAQGFTGAWPYLELIASANGIADPLAPRVVEAYWIGNRLLDRVDVALLGDSLHDRFHAPAGRDWSRLAVVVEQRPRPHHNFHVFCIYPWVGMLRTGATNDALRVLDLCRVRVARVLAVAARGGTAVVESSPLLWDGHRLVAGARRAETVTTARDGRALTTDLQPGDFVACHWDWACHRLSPGQVRSLSAETATQLDLVNCRLAVPPPAAVLG